MKRGFWILWMVVAALAACGDAGDAEKGAPVEPDLGGGKSDVIDRVKVQGRLSSGEPVTGSFTKDLEFHAWTFDVFKDGAVTLDVTQKGSSRGLDTSMFLYGPQKSGRFSDDKLAKDDDSGWGALSRLKGVELEAGTYLVVLGTATGDGRGNYRMLLDCADESCVRHVDTDLDACPDEVEEWLTECIQDTTFELETGARESWEICRDEIDVQDMFDSLCFEDAFTRAPDWCLAGADAFSERLLPACTDVLDERHAPVVSDIELAPARLSDELELEIEHGAEFCDDFCTVFGSAFLYTSADGTPPTAAEAVNAVLASGRLENEGIWVNDGEVAKDEVAGHLNFRGMEDFVAEAQDHTGSELFFAGGASYSDQPFAGVDAFHQLYVMVFPETGWFIVLEITDFTE